MPDTKPSPFYGGWETAKERFLRFTEYGAAHMDAEAMNRLSWMIAVQLRYDGDERYIHKWDLERAAEMNGSLKPRDDAEELLAEHLRRSL